MFTIKFDQFRFKVGTDPRENVPHVIQYLSGEYVSAVFGDKDQMHMHHEDAMSAVAELA